MGHGNEDPQKDKISPEFTARLNRLGPHQKVRAIVMLHFKDAGKARARRQSRVKRQATFNAIRESAEATLPEIDEILERFDGRRLVASVDALGSIPIETTTSGITALAASKHVKTILEDQPISLPPTPRRR